MYIYRYLLQSLLRNRNKIIKYLKLKKKNILLN